MQWMTRPSTIGALEQLPINEVMIPYALLDLV
jgi:hypothetical protein